MKILMKFLLLTLAFNILTINRIEAATLHAILVGDTINDEEFQSGIDYMQYEVKQIAALTDLKLNGLCFTGYQVRVENILNHISKLDIKPDDIVILYFNLHGSRSHEKESQWPDLNFTIDIVLSGNSGYLDFNQINEMVKSKNPRLLLSLAESCNSYRRDDKNEKNNRKNEENKKAFPIPTPSYKRIGLSKDTRDFIKERIEDDRIKAYRHLFLNHKGSIIISSSIPGEFAIKLPIIGGIYTIQFLKTLHHISFQWEAKIKDLNWEFVLEQASKETVKELSIRGLTETPQYEIYLN